MTIHPTLQTHNARANLRGLSRWYVRTKRGLRTIQLQSYKGRLYLYGQFIEKPRGKYEAPYVAVPFEATLNQVIELLGQPLYHEKSDVEWECRCCDHEYRDPRGSCVNCGDPCL